MTKKRGQGEKTFRGWYQDSVLTYVMTPNPPVADTCHWITDAPVMCLSDMHGDYHPMLDLLRVVAS